MRILHTADWHLGDRLGRIDRTADLRRAVERVAGYCESERVDVLLVAGDLFSDLSRPDALRESIGHLREVFLPFLRGGGSIVALTGNHDNETFCQTLRHALTLAAPEDGQSSGPRAGGRLFLATEPAVLTLVGRDGQPVQFVLMPFPTAGLFLDERAQRYESLDERNRALAASYAGRLRALREDPGFRADLPTVLSAHVHVEGAAMPSLFRLDPGSSLILPESAVATGWAYVALGHIHQPQALRDRAHVRYSGSIERLDLGERDDQKGVVVVDVGPKGLRGEPAILPLAATPMLDVTIQDPSTEIPTLRDRYPDAEKALVRYHLSYTPGVDNLLEVQAELDRIFPRWYDRDWQESDALGASRTAPDLAPSFRSVRETVFEYLETELADHPDREAVLALAGEILAEEDRP
jgi:DNA repair exonuclease SbcCD nuclease subunit